MHERWSDVHEWWSNVHECWSKGPSINDVTHLGGEGGHTFVTLRDEGEGGGLKKCDVTSKHATSNQSST